MGLRGGDSIPSCFTRTLVAKPDRKNNGVAEQYRAVIGRD